MRVSPVTVAAFFGLAALMVVPEITAGLPGATASAELYDPGSGGWSATGDMVVRRSQHTATLLSDGTVLAVGNSGDSGGAAARAEQYDPATGKWGEVGSLHVGRTWHTATLLPNGNVLVAGGYGTLGNLASCELYDPVTRVWSVTGNLGRPRMFHTATLLPNGKVLVVGGHVEGGTPSGRTAELYDPASGTWSATGSMNTPRNSHTTTLLPNGKVLVAGGSGDGFELASTELYDPASGIWSPSGNLSLNRISHTAILLANGKVLVAGGMSFVDGTSPHYVFLSSAELYDPATEQWSVTGSMTETRSSATATLLSDGKVLVAAGYRYANGNYTLNSAELYDPATGTWSPTGKLDRKREALTTTLLLTGKVLAAGGYLPAPAQLLNISTRAQVLTGDKVEIAGFIIPGVIFPGVAKAKVILRAIGPSLPFGGEALQDPVLELYPQYGPILGRNDNWKVNDQTGESQETEIRDTSLAPSNDLESAMIAMLEPGNYTVVVRGKNGGTGIGLVEVYNSFFYQLANISTRGFVGAGDKAMIGGFIAGDDAREKESVLVRAMGPSLAVAGALADPTLELHDSNGATIATNDDWKIDSQTGQSQEAAIRATRVPPPPDDRESSIVARVAPGAYTGILRGKNGTTGVALVEIYNLD